MEYGDRIEIATPEGVALDVELAGIGSRLSARLIDFTLQLILLAAIDVALVVSIDDSGLTEGVIVAIATLVGFLVFWGYDTLFETFASGQTPGKRRLGIRVVSEHGGPVTFRMAAIRNVMRLIDEALTLTVAALLAIARSNRNQRLGDMAAGAIVVHDTHERGIASVATAGVAELDRAVAWDATAISAEEVATVRHFLERRQELPSARRVDLASRLAAQLRPRIPGVDRHLEDEPFLEAVAALKASRG